MNNFDFLQKQHPLLKLTFAGTSLVFSSFVNALILVISLILILGLLSFKKKYILSWLQAIARISPLFISIVISGFIFSLPFPAQLELCLRIAFLLTISLFVFLTIPEEFLTTMVNNKPHGLKHDIAKFLWKTSQLIPFFFSSFQEQYNHYKPDFVKAIVISFTRAHSIDQEEIAFPVSKVKIPPLYAKENILLYFLILSEIGLIIWRFI